jgi:hypothetical protein
LPFDSQPKRDRMTSLKDKLNAKTEEARKRRAELEEFGKRAVQQFPLAVHSVLAQVRSLLDGVNGISIPVESVDVELAIDAGVKSSNAAESTTDIVKFGRVSLPTWRVELGGKKLSFRTPGFEGWGWRGKIDVVSVGGGKGPFLENCIILKESEDRTRWDPFYFVKNQRQQAQLQPLTDDALSKVFESFFL